MLRGTITYKGDAEVLRKDLRATVKGELSEVGRFWHRRKLPRHFTTKAETQYDYQARSAAYSRYKAKRFGHRNPLVYTGELKRMVTRMARISSTSKGVRVNMTGPRYLYQYRKDFNQPDKAAELTAVTETETETMAKLLDRRITRRLNANQTQRTRSF